MLQLQVELFLLLLLAWAFELVWVFQLHEKGSSITFTIEYLGKGIKLL
jgi:hypothetical protein